MQCVRRMLLASVAGIALLLATHAGIAQTDALADCKSMYEGVGVPAHTDSDATSEGDITLLCRKGYLLAHNNARKVPDWVMERLTPDRFRGTAIRKNRFVADGALPSGMRSELDDYAAQDANGLHYDRGHMAPAADMKFSQVAMDESFLLSNMAPQVGIGFNRQIWARLEDRVRVWTERRTDMVVITGPIYAEHRALGPNSVAIPEKFFKIAYEPARHRAIALVLPNEQIKGSDLTPFVTTIDAVEELTGLDFFPDLPKSEQLRIEGNTSTLWEQ
jgi:endonuclease G